MFEEVVLETPRARVTREVVGPLENNVYVLTCTGSGEKLAIDATSPDVDGSAHVLITHGHHDHTTAAGRLHQTGVVLHLGGADLDRVDVHCEPIADRDVFEVGALRLLSLHTPGHTPGSMCFLVEGEGVVFSGDTLFPGGPGATKRPESSFADIIDSIRNQLFVLDPSTVVLPGHGAHTTIGSEMPHLEEWIARGW